MGRVTLDTNPDSGQSINGTTKEIEKISQSSGFDGNKFSYVDFPGIKKAALDSVKLSGRFVFHYTFKITATCPGSEPTIAVFLARLDIRWGNEKWEPTPIDRAGAGSGFWPKLPKTWP